MNLHSLFEYLCCFISTRSDSSIKYFYEDLIIFSMPINSDVTKLIMISPGNGATGADTLLRNKSAISHYRGFFHSGLSTRNCLDQERLVLFFLQLMATELNCN